MATRRGPPHHERSPPRRLSWARTTVWLSWLLGAPGGCDAGTLGTVEPPSDEGAPRDTDERLDSLDTSERAAAPPDPPRSPCTLPGRSSAEDEALFQRLVAHPWGHDLQPGGAFPDLPSRGLALWADGTYTWAEGSDILIRREWGWWDFRAIDDRSGLLLLGGQSAISFDLVGDALHLYTDLPPELVAKQAAATAPAGRREDLRHIGPPPEWCVLSATPMRAATAWLQRPDRVRLTPQGTGTLTDGGCEASGRMSMFTQYPAFLGNKAMRWKSEARPSCSADWLAFPEVANRAPDGDGLWLFGHRYRPDGGPPPAPAHLLDARQTSLEIVGDLSGHRARGGLIHLTGSIAANGAVAPVTCSRVTVSTQAVERVDGVLTPRGEPKTQHEADVTCHLGPGEKLPLTVDLVLTDSEAVDIIVALDRTFWTQRLRLGGPP